MKVGVISGFVGVCAQGSEERRGLREEDHNGFLYLYGDTREGKETA